MELISSQQGFPAIQKAWDSTAISKGSSRAEGVKALDKVAFCWGEDKDLGEGLGSSY